MPHDEATAQAGIRERDANRARIADDRTRAAQVWELEQNGDVDSSRENGRQLTDRNESQAWALLLAEDEERKQLAAEHAAKMGELWPQSEGPQEIPAAPPLEAMPAATPHVRTLERASAPARPHMPAMTAEQKEQATKIDHGGFKSLQEQKRRANDPRMWESKAPASGFGGHSGGRRLRPDRANDAALTADDRDQVTGGIMNARRRENERAELAELGGGRQRADRYRGATADDEDMRAVIEDPRLQERYQMERGTDLHADESDSTSKKAKRWIGGKMDQMKAWWNSGRKGKEAAGLAARKAVGAIPIANIIAPGANAYTEHKRAKRAGEVEQDPESTPMMSATAGGLGKAHKSKRNALGVKAVAAGVKTAVGVSTLGASALVPDGIPDSLLPHALQDHSASAAAHAHESLGEKATGWGTKKARDEGGKAAAKKAYGSLKKAGTDDAELAEADRVRPERLRRGAIAPVRGSAEAQQAGTDAANANAYDLMRNDHQLGGAILSHLNADYEESDSLGGALHAARGYTHGDKTKKSGFLGLFGNQVSKEPTVRPSRFAAAQHGEKARQRVIDRSRDQIVDLTENERTNFMEDGIGSNVVVPEGGGVKRVVEDESEET